LFGGLALATPLPLLAQADAGAASRNWEAIAQCSAIADDAQRLACMDGVLRQAGAGLPVARQQAAPRAAGQGAAPGTARQEAVQPAPPAPPAPPAVALSVQRPAAEPPAAKDAEDVRKELTTTIASVRPIGYQRVLVTTAAGSAWEQTEAESFLKLPKAGDAFSVEPAAMGSFRCRFAQSSRYRCKPVS